jgi:hypothetical protein
MARRTSKKTTRRRSVEVVKPKTAPPEPPDPIKTHSAPKLRLNGRDQYLLVRWLEERAEDIKARSCTQEDVAFQFQKETSIRCGGNNVRTAWRTASDGEHWPHGTGSRGTPATNQAIRDIQAMLMILFEAVEKISLSWDSDEFFPDTEFEEAKRLLEGIIHPEP